MAGSLASCRLTSPPSSQRLVSRQKYQLANSLFLERICKTRYRTDGITELHLHVLLAALVFCKIVREASGELPIEWELPGAEDDFGHQPP
jgi:hypothetical protein